MCGALPKEKRAVIRNVVKTFCSELNEQQLKRHGTKRAWNQRISMISRQCLTSEPKQRRHGLIKPSSASSSFEDSQGGKSSPYPNSAGIFYPKPKHDSVIEEEDSYGSNMEEFDYSSDSKQAEEPQRKKKKRRDNVPDLEAILNRSRNNALIKVKKTRNKPLG